MQKHSYYLAKYMAQKGIYVDIYHFVPSGMPLVEELEGFSEEELPYLNHFCFQYESAGRFPGHYIAEMYALSKRYYDTFLKNSDVDFVYAQGFSGWYYAKQLSKGTSLPPIGTNFHGLEMFQKAPSLRVKMEHMMFRYPVKRVCRLSDYTFSLGGKLTGILEHLVCDRRKILVTPIGIDRSWQIDEKIINEYTNIPRKLVFVGRYERRKGIEELMEVLSRLVDSYAFEFHFIGPIPEETQMVSEKVIYHGLLREERVIKAILKDADILVTPSYSEGMPTVILEAMASECAIVATDVGAVSEEVDDANGWLVMPGDTTALYRVLTEALTCSEQELKSKKAHSLKRIEKKFLWDNVIMKTLNEIEKTIKEKGGTT
jgi:glycosyltransferase involved in cell wall biosynthesis